MARILSLEKIPQLLRSYVCSEQRTDGNLDIPIPLKDTQSLLRFIAVEMICLIFSALRLIW